MNRLLGRGAGRASVVILGLVSLVYLGLQVDSGIRALQSTALMTARPASKEIAVFAAAVVAVGIVSLLPVLRLRMLAVLGPLSVVAVVLLATAIIGGQALAMVDAVLIMFALWFSGERLLTWMRLPQFAERGVVSWTAGLVPLVLLATVLGRISAFRWWDMGLLVAILGIAGLVRAAMGLWPRRRALCGAVLGDAVSATSAGVLALTTAVAAVYTAAPEVQYDPLYGKAYLPELWDRTGQIVGIPQHIQLAITGWFQIVGAFGNLLGAGATGRYLQLAAFVGLPIAVWSFARSRGLLAPLAAAAVGLIPMLFWQATTADDDILIAFGTLGIVTAFVTAFSAEFDGGERVTALALGLLVGTGWSMKTHVIPMATVLLIGWFVSIRGSKPKLSRSGWGLVGLLITAAPPLILRWIDLDNPVLPAYNNIFKSPDWLPVNEALNFPFWPGAGLGGLLRSPFEALFNPGQMGESLSPGAFGAFAGVVFLAVLIGWRFRKKVPGSFVLWIALIVAIIVWWKTFRYLRYFLPEGVLATVILLLGAPVLPVPRRLSWRAGLVACVVLGTVGYLSVSVADLWNVPNRKVPIKAALGKWPANDYLTTAAAERPDVLAFNRLSGRNAVMVTNTYERAWLTGNRNLYAPWEITGVAEARHLPTDTPSDSLKALHYFGVNWILTDPANGDIGAVSLDQHKVESEWLAPVIARYGSVRFAANSYVLYQLARRPQSERAAARCDANGGVNLPAPCWTGTRTEGGQISSAATRVLQVCAGETIDLSMTQKAGAAADTGTIVLPQLPSDESSSAGQSTPGGEAHVYETVVGGATIADISVNDPDDSGIAAATVSLIGSCSG